MHQGLASFQIENSVKAFGEAPWRTELRMDSQLAALVAEGTRRPTLKYRAAGEDAHGFLTGSLVVWDAEGWISLFIRGCR
jgi:hypothetical protein